jgi:hypothetical protein
VFSRRSRALLGSETGCGVVLLLATAMGTRSNPSSHLRARILGPAPYGNEHRAPVSSRKGARIWRLTGGLANTVSLHWPRLQYLARLMHTHFCCAHFCYEFMVKCLNTNYSLATMDICR